MAYNIKDLREAFYGRSVFITVSDGFVGSHLTEKLVEFGATLHAFIRETFS